MDYYDMAREVEKQERIPLFNAMERKVNGLLSPLPTPQSRVQWESKGRLPARGKW